MINLFNIKKDNKFPFIHISLNSLYAIFLLSLFLGVFGWVFETTIEIFFSQIVSDRGFLCGPFIPIYFVFQDTGLNLKALELINKYSDMFVKMVDEDNTYLLVWTTTPWTLMSNVAACVNPNEKYVKCLSKGYNFIVAEKLAKKVLAEEYEVVCEYLGKDLEYREYEQLMPILDVNKKAFYITCADYVTMEDGTGIVHIAPAFGADDNLVAQKYDLPFLNPVDLNGRYTCGPWEGRLVTEEELDKYTKECEFVYHLAGVNRPENTEEFAKEAPDRRKFLLKSEKLWYIIINGRKNRLLMIRRYNTALLLF